MGMGPRQEPTPSSGGGRLLTCSAPRAPARPVALKVSSCQGKGIAEEWTDAGTIRFETGIGNKTWKKSDNKRAAQALGRALDVAVDSGQDVAVEAWAEVQLRELAALWYADRTSDIDTADYLRETADSTFGVPRALWLEAKEFRKLTRGAMSG